MKEKVMYLCDPKANTTCRKRTCAYSRTAQYAVCIATSDPKCAQRDGKGNPIKITLDPRDHQWR